MTTPLIEAIARAMWDDRERTFPPFTRMKWESGTDEARSLTLGYVSAVFRALEASGHAVVPIKPTEAMERAASDAMKALGGVVYGEDPCVCYRAMISAAQGDG